MMLHHERQKLESVLRDRMGSFMHKVVPGLPNKVHSDQGVDLKSMNSIMRNTKEFVWVEEG